MDRGRKPKPSHLKLVTGNPGKRPLNENEPKPRLAIPPMPQHLCDVGQAEWKRLAQELFDEGVLTNWDAGVLEAYCFQYGKYRLAQLEMSKSELVVVSATGMLKQNPLIGIINQSLHQMRLFANELGLSPASRSRVSREAVKAPDDEFFGNGKKKA